jgi:hypothetical protein
MWGRNPTTVALDKDGKMLLDKPLPNDEAKLRAIIAQPG